MKAQITYNEQQANEIINNSSNAFELQLFIPNSRDIYYRYYEPLMYNLAKKINKGVELDFAKLVNSSVVYNTILDVQKLYNRTIGSLSTTADEKKALCVWYAGYLLEGAQSAALNY